MLLYHESTIGYGNTAPATAGGKILVVILGFISILAFTFVSGAVGHVTLTIIDDFFRRFKYKRLKMKHLSEGWLSVLFWLTMLVISLFGLAGVKFRFARNRR